MLRLDVSRTPKKGKLPQSCSFLLSLGFSSYCTFYLHSPVHASEKQNVYKKARGMELVNVDPITSSCMAWLWGVIYFCARSCSSHQNKKPVGGEILVPGHHALPWQETHRHEVSDQVLMNTSTTRTGNPYHTLYNSKSTGVRMQGFSSGPSHLRLVWNTELRGWSKQEENLFKQQLSQSF